MLSRTGGNASYPWHETLARPVHVAVVTAAGRAEATLAPPSGALVEIAFELPAPAERAVAVRVTADAPYRVFHWFALQPD